MRLPTQILSLSFMFIISHNALAQQKILADLDFLKTLHIPVQSSSKELNLGIAAADPYNQFLLERNAHAFKKCGGYELLNENSQMIFNQISQIHSRNNLYLNGPFRRLSVQPRPDIQTALSLLSQEKLEDDIKWLSSFPDRYNRSSDPNHHVRELKKNLEEILSKSKLTTRVDLISHTSTKQQSLRVQIQGASHPNEIVVLGGHLDSINQSWGSRKAPGADDNASGSSNLIDTLRVILTQEPPSRTLEFFWYAGEESGLLGSAEIAKKYREQNKDVIAVLQLDMTLYPGAGPMVVGNVSDYTSAWLREYLEGMNSAYSLGLKFVDDKCGYACSDHASWYRQGYPTLLPFEADTARMNPWIHSERDVISSSSRFDHSLAFSKIALIFAMDLGSNGFRQPY